MGKGNKFIIGAGISALIYAFYNKEYIVIGKEIGGQLCKGGVGPMYLHKDEYTEKFLKDLEVKAKIKNIKIGFLLDSELHSDVTSECKKRYFIQSRGLKDDYDVSLIPDTFLNQGKLSFDCYDVNWTEIVDKLKQNVVFIESDVSSINFSYKYIKIRKELCTNYFDYREIISTIPLYNLIKIAGFYQDFKILENTTSNICYGISDTKYYDNGKYDYLYCIDTPFYRITYQEDGKVIYEFSKEYTLEELQNLFPELKIYQSFNVPYGKIIKNLDLKEYRGIKLLGRYSQVNQRIKTETICKVSQQ